MRFLLPALLAASLAGCASFSTRTTSDRFHYWSGEGLGANDRYYFGTKFDHALLYPVTPADAAGGAGFFVGCDMVGSALVDTLCVPMDFYLNETDGQVRRPDYSEKGY